MFAYAPAAVRKIFDFLPYGKRGKMAMEGFHRPLPAPRISHAFSQLHDTFPFFDAGTQFYTRCTMYI